ncbi:MAG: hypothetical protein NT009_09555 [Proteobacteria bacterium]|nr:hypothetical protein [Pseudomonadota bacterium]
MKPKVFSERHEKAILEKRLKISMRIELRKSILRMMDNYSSWDSNNGENMSLNYVEHSMLDRRGWDKLQWWNGEKFISAQSFSEFIVKGTPSHVLDAIELFIEYLNFKRHPDFENDINNLFEIHNSSIRYFQKEFYIIDSAFIESVILKQAQELLQTNQFRGALDEFLRARSAHAEKNYKDTILYSNHAFESTMKSILNIQNKKTGELIKKICHGGLIPSYYESFLNSFYEILCIVPTTRDNEAGHGQGKELKSIPPALAELSLHLSASVIVFLMKRYIEQNPPKAKEDEVPF